MSLPNPIPRQSRSITYTGYLVDDETEPRVTACVRLHAGHHPIARESRVK